MIRGSGKGTGRNLWARIGLEAYTPQNMDALLPELATRLKAFEGKISYDYDWRINAQ